VTVDVSAAKAKERAARFAASFDPGPPGPAGYEHTRRQPVSLSDRQVRLIERFTRLMPKATCFERILGKRGRVIIPDPLGVWWGLRQMAEGQGTPSLVRVARTELKAT